MAIPSDIPLVNIFGIETINKAKEILKAIAYEMLLGIKPFSIQPSKIPGIAIS